LALAIAVLSFEEVGQAEAQTEAYLIDQFEPGAETRWRFFTDQVMGGVSTGRMAILSEMGAPYARLSGDVSTANNGGFIQMRRELPANAAEWATGVRLIVRGNGERYFVHLRTTTAQAPWHYYQGGFEVGRNWTEVRVPFAEFRPSHGSLPDQVSSETLTSLAIVAYGRDHGARIDLREVGFY